MEPNQGPVSSSVPQFLSKKESVRGKTDGEGGETKKMFWHKGGGGGCFDTE